MTTEITRRILWADDEIDLLRPHIRFLEERGFEVMPVPNGEDALEALSHGRFDVVLLDEMMPGLGGLGTLDAIQARNFTVPVILVTKSEEESLMNDAIGRRISDYLIKPVHPSQVLLACKRVFDAQKLQGEQRSRDYVGEMQRWQTLDLRRLDAAGWTELAVDLARWDVRLDAVADSGLQQAHADLRRGLNVEFGRFVEEAYPRWVRGPRHGEEGAGDRPPLSTDVVRDAVLPPLRAGERVVFVIIDCMRLDQWFAIEPLLEELFEVRRSYHWSILPTATPYSRNAIFSGLLPAELSRRHPDMWQEIGPAERTKNRFERQLLEVQLEREHVQLPQPLKYLKIFDQDEALNVRRQAGSFAGLPLLSLVYNFLDILTHGRTESEILQELAPDEAAFRAVMKTWFAHSPLYDVLRQVAARGATVVLTTDHGAVLGRRAALVYGDRETSTNLRYKYGHNLNCDAKHALIIRRPADFMLPSEGINKNYILAREDFFFVYPTRFHEFERQFKGSFQHGGVSLEEMILPLVTLVPRRP